MKCPNCGAEMPLEYPFCPYCGAKNKAAEQHAADMKKYESEFARTKAEVETHTRRYGTNLIKAAAAVVLVILILITMVINNNAWSFRRDLVQKEAEKHYDTVSESLCRCLADGNYVEFSSFIDHYGLTYVYDSPFRSFQRVITSVNYYLEIEKAYMDLLHPDKWDTQETIANDLNYSMQNFYDHLEREKENPDPQAEKYPEPPEAAAAIEDMQRKIGLLAVTYLGFPEDTAADLGNMSRGTRAKLVEEGVQHAFEQRNQ